MKARTVTARLVAANKRAARKAAARKRKGAPSKRARIAATLATPVALYGAPREPRAPALIEAERLDRLAVSSYGKAGALNGRQDPRSRGDFAPAPLKMDAKRKGTRTRTTGNRPHAPNRGPAKGGNARPTAGRCHCDRCNGRAPTAHPGDASYR